MFSPRFFVLCALVSALIGCAHQSKDASLERSLLSRALLAETNAPHGSVYSTRIYVVQKGDSLSKIAANFNTTANELRRLNPVVNPNRLYIGDRIRVAEEKFTRFVGDPEWFTLNSAIDARLRSQEQADLNDEQRAQLKELSLKVKTGNSVADIDRLKDSLKRWDELFMNPAPPELKPVYGILKDRVRERIAELEVEKEKFGTSIFGDFGEARERMRHYKNVLLVCVTACHWEDQGEGKYSLHHFSGTVVKSYKGNWTVSEKIDFVHGVDSRGSGERNESEGKLLFIFTNDHSEKEFAVEAGDFLTYDAQLERQLEMILAR